MMCKHDFQFRDKCSKCNRYFIECIDKNGKVF